METLSTIGGYTSGTLIGPAYGASYILLRTENDSSETPFEEDKWIAGIEWADSIGVQVTSTSLGYLDYDAPYKSWTWQDMNGRTTPISRAAAMAVRKGIIVVNSAGNNGIGPNFPNQNTLNAPADADSVLAVGALTPAGSRASFSSVGPTTSIPPRIKPDVMAQGTSVVVADPYNRLGIHLRTGDFLLLSARSRSGRPHPQGGPDRHPDADHQRDEVHGQPCVDSRQRLRLGRGEHGGRDHRPGRIRRHTDAVPL